jgi:hypothetical protein
VPCIKHSLFFYISFLICKAEYGLFAEIRFWIVSYFHKHHCMLELELIIYNKSILMVRLRFVHILSWSLEIWTFWVTNLSRHRCILSAYASLYPYAHFSSASNWKPVVHVGNMIQWVVSLSQRSKRRCQDDAQNL